MKEKCLDMKQIKTKAPTIQFVVELKQAGDSELGWTLIQDDPKIYVDESGAFSQENKIIIDSDIRNTVKRGYSNPLEKFYNIGDKIRVITRNYNITGVIKFFTTTPCGSQKDYIALKLITEKPEDCLYRFDIFEDFAYNSILSERKEHFIYSGIMSISKIHD